MNRQIALGLVAAMLLVPGTVAAAPAEDDARGGTVRTALTDPVGTIHPQLVDELEAFQVTRLLFSALTEIDAEREVVPAAAESWTADEGDTRFTFTLHPDGRFHNGRPVEAADFVYAFTRAAQLDLASVPIKGWEDVGAGRAESLAGVSAPDDRTLVIETDGPYALLPMELSYVTFAPLPAEELETAPEEEAYAERPVGNGPYRMAEARSGERILLTRFDDYHGKPGKPAAVEFQIHADDSEAYEALLAGRLDVVRISGDRFGEARERLGNRLVVAETAVIVYLSYPVDQAPFDRPEVRDALSLALDRQGIIEELDFGGAVPASGMAHPGLPGARSDRCPACRFDEDAARKALDEAGGPPSGPVKLYAIEGNDQDFHKLMAAAWERVGLKVELTEVSIEAWEERFDGGRFDGIFVSAHAPGLPSAYDALAPFVPTDGVFNNSGYSNPEVDGLMRQIEGTASAEERAVLLDQVQTIVGRDLPVLPVAFLSLLFATSERVSGLRVDYFSSVHLEEVVVAPDS